MTAPRPSQFTAQAPAAADDVAMPIPQPLVEEACRLLSKALRARLLYLPNNPNYAKSAELFSASFIPMWEHAQECVLTITETAILYGATPVFRGEEGQSGESLPWLFFKDGLRELRFLPGFEYEESTRFLDLLTKSRKALPDEDDLLTLLWQGEFVALRYRFVDVALDGPQALEYGGEGMPERVVDSWGATTPPELQGFGDPAGQAYGVGGAGVGEGLAAASAATAPGQAPPSGVVNLADFDATLYVLDEREIEYLREEVRKEYARDHRVNLISMLLDIFELQTDPLVREEICGLLDNYILALLSAGEFRAVAFLLVEAGAAVQRARELEPSHRARLGSLADRLSQPETLSQLLQALDDAADLPTQEELTELFNQLKPSALRTVFQWLGRLAKPVLRQQLEVAAGALASQNTGELVRLVAADDKPVALEATRRAGALRSAAAVAPLGKRLGDADAELRLAAVTALAEIGSAGALQLIERMIEDADREVRLASARALAAKAYKPALPRLEAAVKGKALRDRDLTERMATFEAYGAVAGDPGVALLDGLLNGKGFLGRREDPEVRACAAMALGRVGTPKAREALQKAAGDAKDDAIVRNAVNRALKGGAA